MTPVITQSYVHSGQTVTYKITVQNESNQDLNNIVVQDIMPDNAIYTYVAEKEGDLGNYIEIAQDSKIKLREWEIESLKANQTVELEIMLTMGAVQKTEEIINIVKVVYNEQAKEVKSKLVLKPALIETELDYK